MAKKVIIETTVEHAQALVNSTELLTRLSLGQIQYIAELVQTGQIPFSKDDCPIDESEKDYRQNSIEKLSYEIKTMLGFHRNASRGIGGPDNPKDAALCWELKKSVEQALSIDRDPNPSFKGTNYDGNLVPYSGLEFPATKIQQVD